MKLSCPGGGNDNITTCTTVLEPPRVELDCKHYTAAAEIESSFRDVKTCHCDCQQDMTSSDINMIDTGRESISRENGDCCTNHLPSFVERILWGYPMSRYLLDLPDDQIHLSYEAREVACHSIDTYRERLVGEI